MVCLRGLAYASSLDGDLSVVILLTPCLMALTWGPTSLVESVLPLGKGAEGEKEP